MKVLISGSRDYNYYGVFKRAMIDVLSELQYKLYFRKKDVEIVEGGAWGVDYMARRFAKESSYILKDFPADWDNLDPQKEKVSVAYNQYTGTNFNKLAGINRNIKMMDYINSSAKKVIVIFQMDKSKGAQSVLDMGIKSKHPMYHFEISSKKEDCLKLNTYNTESIWVKKYS